MNQQIASLRQNAVTVGWSVAIVAAVGVAVFVLVPAMSNASLLSGQQAPFADYVWAAASAFVLALAIAAWPMARAEKNNLLSVWVIKAFVTLFFVPFYESHYNGGLDAYMYFNVGAYGSGAPVTMHFGDGTANIIGLVHGVTRVLPAYLHLLEMLWSFVGLLAVYVFYRGWRWLVPQLGPRVLLWIGLFPGILFWSSILGKDPITLFGAGLYFCAVAHWYRTSGKHWLLMAVVGVAIAAFIRPWYGLILTAPLVAFVLAGHRLRRWQKAIVLVVVAVGTLYALHALLNNFQIGDASELVATSNQVSHSWARGGSGQQTSQFHSIAGMLAFIPFGAFTALFRPVPGEGGGFMLFAGLENAVLLGLFACALWRMPPRRLGRSIWVAWLVLLLIVWAAMYAFPSSQNLGSAVRFKLTVLPILWPLLLMGALRKPWCGFVPLHEAKVGGGRR